MPAAEPGQGRLLFRRGTPCHGFYGVSAGMIQLSVSHADGGEKVLEIIGPGETFGEAVMFLGRPYPVDASALVRTELLMIPVEVVNWLLDEEPGFARALLASMASRLHTMVSDIEMYTLPRRPSGSSRSSCASWGSRSYPASRRRGAAFHKAGPCIPAGADARNPLPRDARA